MDNGIFADPLPPNASTVDDMDIDLDVVEDEPQARVDQPYQQTVRDFHPICTCFDSRCRLGESRGS